MIRFIFCATTGRSGSHYLCELLKQVENCRAEHEPEPVMNGRPMREYLRGNAAPLRALMPAKLAAMESSQSKDEVYAETNHCFIKGFGWLLPDYVEADSIGVIGLHRDPESVRRSLSRILCSPFLPSGDQWIITPAASPRQIELPLGFRFPLLRFHLYRWLSRTIARPGIVRRLSAGRRQALPFIRRYEHALLNWYIAETEARWRLYQKQFPAIRAVDVVLEDLNTIEGVRVLLDAFELQPKSTLADVVGKRTNPKTRPGRRGWGHE
jgi:hypothetical protein